MSAARSNEAGGPYGVPGGRQLPGGVARRSGLDAVDPGRARRTLLRGGRPALHVRIPRLRLRPRAFPGALEGAGPRRRKDTLRVQVCHRRQGRHQRVHPRLPGPRRGPQRDRQASRPALRGPLSPHLRLDIPFIPHIAIANSTDPRACKALADRLNREEFEIKGSVGALDAASYEDDRVTTIERVPLGGP